MLAGKTEVWGRDKARLAVCSGSRCPWGQGAHHGWGEMLMLSFLIWGKESQRSEKWTLDP